MLGLIKRRIERWQVERNEFLRWQAAARTLREVRRLGYEPPDILRALAGEPVLELGEADR
jgi:hypothetical protein